jgi:uncharacterized membrane protein
MQIFRWLRHAFTTPHAVRRAFNPDSLARIEQAIADSEKFHSGEIRFAVEATLPWSYLRRDATARERAEMVFAKLGVWDTELNNGVLIYVEMADHRIEIVADRAISRRVSPGEWQTICEQMREHYRAGRFEQGTLAAIEAAGALLAAHFPLAEGDANEDQVSNRPTLL